MQIKKISDEVVGIIVMVRDMVFQLFEKGGNSKEELHNYAQKQLSENHIALPNRRETYRDMVERLAREKSPHIIPNGTGPYEELCDFFEIAIS